LETKNRHLAGASGNQRLETALVKQILMRPMGYLGFEPILCQRLHDLKLVKTVVDAFYV